MNHSHYRNLVGQYNQMKKELDEIVSRKTALMQDCLAAQHRYLSSLKYEDLAELIQQEQRTESSEVL
jgi:hypothetical protein